MTSCRWPSTSLPSIAVAPLATLEGEAPEPGAVSVWAFLAGNIRELRTPSTMRCWSAATVWIQPADLHSHDVRYRWGADRVCAAPRERPGSGGAGSGAAGTVSRENPARILRAHRGKPCSCAAYRFKPRQPAGRLLGLQHRARPPPEKMIGSYELKPATAQSCPRWWARGGCFIGLTKLVQSLDGIAPITGAGDPAGWTQGSPCPCLAALCCSALPQWRRVRALVLQSQHLGLTWRRGSCICSAVELTPGPLAGLSLCRWLHDELRAGTPSRTSCSASSIRAMVSAGADVKRRSGALPLRPFCRATSAHSGACGHSRYSRPGRLNPNPPGNSRDSALQVAAEAGNPGPQLPRKRTFPCWRLAPCSSEGGARKNAVRFHDKCENG